MPWTVEQRGNLWRVVNESRVWGANKGCTEEEARAVCAALNDAPFRSSASRMTPEHVAAAAAAGL